MKTLADWLEELAKEMKQAGEPQPQKPVDVPGKLGGYYETVEGVHVGPLMTNANCECHPWRSRGDKYAPDAFKRELTPAEIAALRPWTPLDEAHETLQMTLATLGDAMDLARKHRDRELFDKLQRVGNAIDDLLLKDNTVYAQEVAAAKERQANTEQAFDKFFRSVFQI